MANQYVNKVEYGNDTLIDLTSDTVTAADLANGVTAHDRSGAPIVGTGMGGHTIQNASGTDMTARAGLQFLNANVADDSANDKTVVSTNASLIPATDTENLLGGGAGETSTTQALLDEIADRVADKLLTKTAASSLYLPQSVQNVVGCKNLLPNSASTQAINGVTFTVNSDGSVKVNGTATAQTYFMLNTYRYRPYPVGDFTVSTGAANNNFAFVIDKYSSSSGAYVGNLAFLNTADSQNVTIDYNDYDYLAEYLSIASGTVISNKTIYPMLRPASYKDSTYEPYAMTNRELTAATTATVAYNTTNCSGGSMKITRLGNLRIVTGYFEPRTTATSASPITVATLSAGDYSDISSGTRSLCGREKFNTQSEFVIGGVATLTAAGNIVYQGYSSGANMFFTLVFAV